VFEAVDEQGKSRRTSTQWYQREPGWATLEIEYRSCSDLPARLQLWWESDSFAAEPIPAWLFFLPDELPPQLAEDQRHEQARQWVEKFGCARCHNGVWPGVDSEWMPGPTLHPSAHRWNRTWLMRWLEAPHRLRPQTTMPVLFSQDRRGYVERWVIATLLTQNQLSPALETGGEATNVNGDHRMGRRLFISVGCAACHYLPDVPQEEQIFVDQWALHQLADRWNEESLAGFLLDPLQRYRDGRMPRLPLSTKEARDIAAYLLLWSRPSDLSAVEQSLAPPTAAELEQLKQEYQVLDELALARALMRAKRCHACHGGLELGEVESVPVRASYHGGCLDGQSGPKFSFSPSVREAIDGFIEEARREHSEAPFFRRQQLDRRYGCTRCHQRDTDEPPPIEKVGATLGGAWLQRIPYQRTPRLNFPLGRLEYAYLRDTLQRGVQQPRDPEYTYRMPMFGELAAELVQGLAEADGELLDVEDGGSVPGSRDDPTAASLYGPELVGSQGYSCISCHVWKGKFFSDPDPGAVAPDLTRMAGRIRREWFEVMLENPLRLCPRTPMPAVFPRGQPALIGHILDGDPQRQRQAIWQYLSLGPNAPDPLPPSPWLVEPPGIGQAVRVAQVPMHIGNEKSPLESITIWDAQGRVYVFDVTHGGLFGLFSSASVHRHVLGRLRTYRLTAKEQRALPSPQPVWFWTDAEGNQRVPAVVDFRWYERYSNGATFVFDLQRSERRVPVSYSLRIDTSLRVLTERLQLQGLGSMDRLELERPNGLDTAMWRVELGSVQVAPDNPRRLVIRASEDGRCDIELKTQLSESVPPVSASRPKLPDTGRPSGPLERPGYRAVAIPVPQSSSGEDAVMPSAIAITPKSGRVFVASMKMGEIWQIEHPLGDPAGVTWRDSTRGLFQEAYSMTADEQAVYVLHRRNLTAVKDTDQDGLADRFERIAALPHGVGDTYDYGYGLVREPSGSFVFSFAPYANRHIAGSGGAVRYEPWTKTFPEIAFGMRNPVGWCIDGAGNIFFTDNQGEWVATNKLCCIVEGCYYGFPNPDQRQHTTRPFGRTAVWIPYAWAHSINGVAWDSTEGKFGPFAGQFFLAELMFGGAIIRADVERVRGQMQGVCFPFWGKGLLGPLTLAFHPRGPLFVGSITEPGWMAQPDRGALYRIEYTGEIPFEMQTIRVAPDGFRIVFTKPVDRDTASESTSYRIEHFRYEYTGAYGSPELDRTEVPVREVVVNEDGSQVRLRVDRLVPERVYMISAAKVRSSAGESLVAPVGAYTLQEVPERD